MSIIFMNIIYKQSRFKTNLFTSYFNHLWSNILLAVVQLQWTQYLTTFYRHKVFLLYFTTGSFHFVKNIILKISSVLFIADIFGLKLQSISFDHHSFVALYDTRP